MIDGNGSGGGKEKSSVARTHKQEPQSLDRAERPELKLGHQQPGMGGASSGKVPTARWRCEGRKQVSLGVQMGTQAHTQGKLKAIHKVGEAEDREGAGRAELRR